jgi:class 3 adenylate cyclase
MAGTRKIATILVADIVGYSRLASADEDLTPSQRFRARLHGLYGLAKPGHDGRILQADRELV